MTIIEKIEEYINDIDISKLTMEELEHYTKIVIALENKHLNDVERAEILKELNKSR